MRDETVSRNYAEALFDLAQRHDGIEIFHECIDTVATLLDENPSFRALMETPRVDAEEKKKVVQEAFASFPTPFVNFLLVTIDKRRQRLLSDIARSYGDLMDEHLDRMHVDVTLARPIDEEARNRVAEMLSALLGKTAIPHMRVRPEIIGGIVVRAGDTIYDGSILRRLSRMRRQLNSASGAVAAGGPSPQD